MLEPNANEAQRSFLGASAAVAARRARTRAGRSHRMSSVADLGAVDRGGWRCRVQARLPAASAERAREGAYDEGRMEGNEYSTRHGFQAVRVLERKLLLLCPHDCFIRQPAPSLP